MLSAPSIRYDSPLMTPSTIRELLEVRRQPTLSLEEALHPLDLEPPDSPAPPDSVTPDQSDPEHDH